MRFLPCITIFTAAVINLRRLCANLWAALTLTTCAVITFSSDMAFIKKHSLQDFERCMLNDYFKKLEADTLDIPDDANSTILSDCPYIQANLIADKFSSSSLTFRSLYLKIRSSSNKKNFCSFFCSFLEIMSYHPTIIGLTKTWLKSNRNGPGDN